MFIKVSVPGQFRLKMMPSFRSFLMHRDGEVHYIGGTDILPAPFDSVREAEVLRKFGTSEDKEARSALIEHNLRLVVYIARNELLLSDILGTDEDIIYRDLEDETERKLLNAAIDRLNPREQKIVKLRFGLGREQEDEMTQKEVADLLGISQSYISRLEKKIMKRLKKEISQQCGLYTSR